MNGLLLGAAATALTVKGALTGPLGAGAEEPLGHARDELANAKDAALARVGQTVTGSLLPASSSTASRPVPTHASRALQSHDPDRALVHGQMAMRNILVAAAHRHGVDPKLLLALSFWESGWDQTKVSATGAVGLMQVEPSSAATAGPGLLGRTVDIDDPFDNADVGAAIFREDLDNFNDPAMALAAYYQGPDSVRADGMLPDTQQYVEGIMDLAARI